LMKVREEELSFGMEEKSQIKLLGIRVRVLIISVRPGGLVMR